MARKTTPNKRASFAPSDDEAMAVEAIHNDFVPYLMRQITASLARGLTGALKSHGENPNTWRVLYQLTAQETCTLTQLCNFLLIDQSTVSRTVDQMEKRGLIERQTDESDARVTKVAITPSGREKFMRLMPAALAQSDWAMRGISAEDRERLVRILHVMLDNIRHSPFK